MIGTSGEPEKEIKYETHLIDTSGEPRKGNELRNIIHSNKINTLPIV